MDDLLDLVAMLPWWAGVLLAPVSYLWLHKLAVQPLGPVFVPGKAGSGVVQMMVTGLATSGQYILPVICLAGAGLSAWRRRERRQLAREAAAKSDLTDALHGMSWQRFELLVGEAFRQRGYRVLENGGGGADGGVDLVLMQGRDKYLVQCKQWRAQKVCVTVVRELFGVMAANAAAGGFVVSAGRFTAEAQAFASGRHIELIDGERLHAMLRDANAATGATPAGGALGSARVAPSSATPLAQAPASDAPKATAMTATPPCPSCGQAMVARQARRGAQAGRSFWGCSTYPACRGTRDMA